MVADMDLNKAEKCLTAAVDRCNEAWVHADEDKKPVYKEALGQAEGRLSNFQERMGRAGEHARAEML